MKSKLHAISAAVLLAMATAAPAHAGLERLGPVDRSPSVGGFPSWYQDHSGITLEFCSLSTQAEWDGGWCVLIQPDGPAGGLPETFPDNFFDEHFYYAADNTLLDAGTGLRGRLVLALESAFANGAPAEGDQMVFTRHRLDIRPLPFDGDYRVITPFSDTTYFDQKVGDRIFDTLDIGTACPTTFECSLSGTLGPFLLASATAGGAEVPPMPDLQSSPPGTDPFYDQMVALGAGPTAAPGTGKKYLADPARVGTVTGSPLPDFTAFNTDGTSTLRNHNTFRIEVRPSTPDRNAPVFYTVDGESNFTLNGRLMTGNLPGRVGGGRAIYRADATGAATDVDVFTTASPTVQARIPAQPVQGVVKPLLSFYPQPCGGAITVDANGAITVNPPPYSAPAGSPTSMANDDGSTDYWGQVAVSGPPPSHVCIVDTTARNAAGQLEPAYSLRAVTDDVVIKTATYNGPQDGTLAVTAESSDPTAVLTLAGFGTTPGADGTYTGRGPGAELAANAVTVKSIKSPPTQVQVVSSKGGANMHTVQTARGMSVAAGQVIAGNDTGTVFEDCASTPATSCAAGQSLTIDLLANDTVLVAGQSRTLRELVQQGATVTVNVVQTARLGIATVSADGILSYVPNANTSGTDGVTYTVSYNGGPVSDPATASITVTPVNDAPVAGNTTVGAVQNTAMTMNLISNATDPDGFADVKNAVITSWPPQLGTQPLPVNGSITFTPTTTGNFTFGYKVVDAAGAESANTGTGTVTVIAGETITLTRVRFETNGLRWRVDGTDTIQASQTISVTFMNGTLATGPNAGRTCDGTDTIPECVVGTTGVTTTNTFSLDQRAAAGSSQDIRTSNPKWSSVPTVVRAWSSNPVLGGGATLTIQAR
ncbi:cadherin-like domain-containing protein [Ramlibacter sp. AN1133]|uniref:cadherin-like domain-containing protein n=1 Tax=Ramlibacter sp. AN1133 TaxID=3133429 RepID=UPI0030C2C256